MVPSSRTSLVRASKVAFMYCMLAICRQVVHRHATLASRRQRASTPLAPRRSRRPSPSPLTLTQQGYPRKTNASKFVESICHPVHGPLMLIGATKRDLDQHTCVWDLHRRHSAPYDQLLDQRQIFQLVRQRIGLGQINQLAAGTDGHRLVTATRQHLGATHALADGVVEHLRQGCSARRREAQSNRSQACCRVHEGHGGQEGATAAQPTPPWHKAAGPKFTAAGCRREIR